jgi:hypothetical protein
MKAVLIACVVFGAAIAGPVLAGERSAIGGNGRVDRPPHSERFRPDTGGIEAAAPTTASLAMREAWARSACRDRFGAQVTCAAATDDRFGGMMKRNGKNHAR